MLSVSRLIRVTVNLGAAPVAGRSFTTLMIAGDSNVISGLQRFRSYGSLEAVGDDGFSSTSPEYLASELYFSQVPKPASLKIGRWLRTATAGFNLGAILSPTQQALANWTAITTGAFKISVDGAAQESLTGLDFSAATNLNGVASDITAALTGAVCTWTGEAFEITSTSTGPGATAVGTINFTGNPAPGDTVTPDGTLITFVASSPIGSQVVVGATEAITFNNLLTFLQASVDTNISKANYSVGPVGTQIAVTYKTPGTAGNAYTLVESSSALTVSGAVLAGGTQPSSIGYATSPSAGADISTMLGLTSATSQGLASGYAAESPVQCITALADASSAWYGAMFAASVMPTVTQNLAVSAFVEALELTRTFGVTTQDTGCLSSLVTNDIGSLMKASGYNQSCSQYSSTSLYAIASFFGRAFSVDFDAQNSTIDLMYKQEPGVVAESLSSAQADALQAKNINVYAQYDNGTSIIQYGKMAGGDYFDEIQGLDWFQNAVQTSVYNLLYSTTTKIPQTEAGQNQLVNAVSAVCGNQPGGAVYNGLAGPGTWNSTDVFGSLQPGQYLPLGFYIYTPSVNLQAESDRAARLAPPIQVALKLAGAFQEADVLVTVNR